MSLSIRKRGRYWHARGTIPERQADGRITRVRIEESTREVSKARAARVAADLAQYHHELAYRPKAKASPSFTDAAITYVETVGKKRFVAKLIQYFQETPIDQIDQAAISSAAHALYPGCSASTHSRAVFAPTVTILCMAGVRPNIKRPKIIRRPIEIPPEDWFDAILPHCPPRLAALLVFLTLTGRRISEAIALTENDLDGTTVSISRTKTGVPVSVDLPLLVQQFFDRASDGPSGGPGRRLSQRLFGYSTKDNAHRALRRICDKHGLPYYSSHSFGRHAFATRLLKQGKSLKFVMDAGGWKTIKMVAERYGHLEKSEVQDQVKEVQERWTMKRRLPAP